MKTYLVVVDYLKHDGSVFCKATYPIRARNEEEAEAIVHNDMSLKNEQHFRISKVEEVKGNAD